MYNFCKFDIFTICWDKITQKHQVVGVNIHAGSDTVGCSSLPLPPPAVYSTSPEALLCQVDNTLWQSRDLNQSLHRNRHGRTTSTGSLTRGQDSCSYLSVKWHCLLGHYQMLVSTAGDWSRFTSKSNHRHSPVQCLPISANTAPNCTLCLFAGCLNTTIFVMEGFPLNVLKASG